MLADREGSRSGLLVVRLARWPRWPDFRVLLGQTSQDLSKRSPKRRSPGSPRPDDPPGTG